MRVDIRRIRKRLGWSQGTLAQELGVASATVSRWERGKHQPSSAVYPRLLELWLRENGQGKPPSIKHIAAAPDTSETASTQHIEGTTYKTKVFQLGRDSWGAYPTPPGGSAEPPGRPQPGPDPWLPRRESPALQPRPTGRILLPYREDKHYPPKPTHNRRLVRILARVAIPMVAFLVLPLVIFGAASAQTGNRGELNPGLPQSLSKMLPHLDLFVQQSITDFTSIGRAYIDRDYKAKPGAGPEGSLEKLLGSVSELNKEIDGQMDDKGMFSKATDFLRQMRQEAWSRATLPH